MKEFDDVIREEMNKTEPKEGAKERMLQAIYEKAAKQNQKNKRTALLMRISKFALPVAACLLVLVLILKKPWVGKENGSIATGTEPGEKEEPTGQMMIPNPIVEHADAEALRAYTGITVRVPTGAADVRYLSIEKEVAEARFTLGGHDYTYRASTKAGDISGLYGTDEAAEDIGDAVYVEVFCGDETYRKVEYKKDGLNCVLMNTDGASKADVLSVYEKLR